METNAEYKPGRDNIPEDFDTVAEAAEFWDTHSAADYWDLMQEVDMQFDVKGHITLVKIRDDIYPRTRSLAKSQNLSVEEFVNQILAREVEKLPAP